MSEATKQATPESDGKAEVAPAAPSGARDGQGDAKTTPGTPEQGEALTRLPDDSIHEALLAAQREAPALQKDAINPHFGSKFISLNGLMAAVLPILNRHGLVLVQRPTTLDGQPALQTEITHAPTGEGISTTMLLLATKSDPQAQGSALTYARRYSLMAMLGLVADEDDDGNQATAKQSGTATQGAASSAASKPDRMRERIGKLCAQLDVKTKAPPGTFRRLTNDGVIKDWGLHDLEPGADPLLSLDEEALGEVGTTLAVKYNSELSEVPEQLDFVVPF